MSIQLQLEGQLSSTFPNELVIRLIDNYLLVKENFYLSKYREAAQYGGRYTEIYIRILQYIIQAKSYTPLGTQLPNIHSIVVGIERLPAGSYIDSIKFHIPRTLEIIYDIRNKRDVGHVGGDIDANYSDAIFSLYSCTWTLVELIRIYYINDIKEAQKLVNNLTRIRVPIIQNFDGYLKILNVALSLPTKIMALLYYKKDEGLSYDELLSFLNKYCKEGYLRKSLRMLENEKAYIHFNGRMFLITDSGMRWAEKNISFDFEK